MDTGAKYRDKVTPEVKMAFETIAFAADMVGPWVPVYQETIDAEQRMHSVGHILDPTMYRDMIWSKNFALTLRMAKAAVAFHKEIEAVREEAAKLKAEEAA